MTTNLTGKRIHFMGVGGIGVSALALMARNAGAIVSGCDRTRSDMIALLEDEGMDIRVGHDREHVVGTDLLVYTSAVPAEHPELLAAAKKEMRGRFLARFLDDRFACGVSGTHGKTTTSWLLAKILMHCGRDPSVFIGGVVGELPGRNHRLGSGPFVAELDESDGSFLFPKLNLAVITNVESDHLAYYGDDAAVRDAFGRFAAGVRDAGILVAGADNAVSESLYAGHDGRKLSFGCRDGADLVARNIAADAAGSRFRVVYRGEDIGEFVIAMPGLHNIRNALAAMGAALEMDVLPDCIRGALAGAKGVERRMERLGGFHGAALYSDYAHHPTEVAAAIAGMRQWHKGAGMVVFQPHLYSRTRDYAEGFGAALASADTVLLVDVYPARETPIPGVDSNLVAEAARRRNANVHGPVPLEAVEECVARLADGHEAVILMGAGDIDAVARKMAAAGC